MQQKYKCVQNESIFNKFLLQYFNNKKKMKRFNENGITKLNTIKKHY